MLPIEEGCRAVVIGSWYPGNLGKEVIVGKYIGTLPFPAMSNEGNVWYPKYREGWWEVDRPLQIAYKDGRKGEGTIDMTRECHLMRIDGHIEDEEIREVEELET